MFRKRHSSSAWCFRPKQRFLFLPYPFPCLSSRYSSCGATWYPFFWGPVSKGRIRLQKQKDNKASHRLWRWWRCLSSRSWEWGAQCGLPYSSVRPQYPLLSLLWYLPFYPYLFAYFSSIRLLWSYPVPFPVLSATRSLLCSSGTCRMHPDWGIPAWHRSMTPMKRDCACHSVRWWTGSHCRRAPNGANRWCNRC